MRKIIGYCKFHQDEGWRFFSPPSCYSSFWKTCNLKILAFHFSEEESLTLKYTTLCVTCSLLLDSARSVQSFSHTRYCITFEPLSFFQIQILLLQEFISLGYLQYSLAHSGTVSLFIFVFPVYAEIRSNTFIQPIKVLQKQ